MNSFSYKIIGKRHGYMILHEKHPVRWHGQLSTKQMVQISKLRILCIWVNTMAFDFTFSQLGRNPKISSTGTQSNPFSRSFFPNQFGSGRRREKLPQSATNRGPLWMCAREPLNPGQALPSQKDCGSRGFCKLGSCTTLISYWQRLDRHTWNPQRGDLCDLESK